MPNTIDVFSLEGRVALITGASAGLGVRFAEVLHGAGASVALAARRADLLESVASSLPQSLPVIMDVADRASVTAGVKRVLDHFGHIDILVNNAGITAPVAAEFEGLTEFQRVIDVNLTGLFHVTQEVVRPMLVQGYGSIVNIASIVGLVASGQIPQASYAASKGAVVNLTRELGVQWARRGVRVNAIAPGWFASEMTTDLFESDTALGWVNRYTPMGRTGRREELDGALLFLASEASSFVTGATVPVDGGWVAR